MPSTPLRRRYGTVLRGDVNAIKVGAFTNIQDNCVVHVAKHNVANKAQPTIIGDKVTIGHGATIHACTIEDEVIVGAFVIMRSSPQRTPRQPRL